ncbi:hypothetical protein M422DRAFT_272956, partial [Sphaerobolus stellatus SS14]
MSYCQPISDKQLAPFLEAAKLMTIPVNEVPPLEIEEVLAPSKSSNETILAMNPAMIVQAIKMNTENVAKYEKLKELWYRETAIAAYLAAKKKADEEEAKRKAEEAAAKKAAEEEDECVMDANSEGEVKVEVNKDETPKLKLKLKLKLMKSCPIVDSESEEETEEVKAKRRKAKGKGKAVDPEYSRNTVPIDYAGCPGIPVRKICEGCKVPANTWYQRPCIGDVLMDVNDKIFYVRSKNRCFVCHMRNNVCSFTCDDEVDFIMLEAMDDEELQAKLRKLCNEQDVFKTQKDKEKAERSKAGKRPKAGTKKTVQVNAKALGSIPKGSKRKVVSEEENIEVTSRLKRARMVVNSDGSVERIPSVAESLHGINKALIVTVDLLGDTRAANENQAKYLRSIEISMANLWTAHRGSHTPLRVTSITATQGRYSPRGITHRSESCSDSGQVSPTGGDTIEDFLIKGSEVVVLRQEYSEFINLKDNAEIVLAKAMEATEWLNTVFSRVRASMSRISLKMKELFTVPSNQVSGKTLEPGNNQAHDQAAAQAATQRIIAQTAMTVPAPGSGAEECARTTRSRVPGDQYSRAPLSQNIPEDIPHSTCGEQGEDSQPRLGREAHTVYARDTPEVRVRDTSRARLARDIHVNPTESTQWGRDASPTNTRREPVSVTMRNRPKPQSIDMNALREEIKATISATIKDKLHSDADSVTTVSQSMQALDANAQYWSDLSTKAARRSHQALELQLKLAEEKVNNLLHEEAPEEALLEAAQEARSVHFQLDQSSRL